MSEMERSLIIYFIGVSFLQLPDMAFLIKKMCASSLNQRLLFKESSLKTLIHVQAERTGRFEETEVLTGSAEARLSAESLRFQGLPEQKGAPCWSGVLGRGVRSVARGVSTLQAPLRVWGPSLVPPLVPQAPRPRLQTDLGRE